MSSLPTCPREDCTALIGHWHNTYGTIFACLDALNGRECGHDAERENHCYAPRTSQPPAVVLPTVDEVADAILASSTTGEGWHVSGARAALNLIAARITPWHPVEPGTIIKAGTRVREDWDDQITEWTLGQDEDPYAMRSSRSARLYIDPRTVPAEPEDPDAALVTADQLDRLRILAVGVLDAQPTDSPWKYGPVEDDGRTVAETMAALSKDPDAPAGDRLYMV